MGNKWMNVAHVLTTRICDRGRFEAVDVGLLALLVGAGLGTVVGFAAVGVVGNHGALDEHKVQVHGGGDVVQSVLIDDIPVLGGKLDPLSRWVRFAVRS